MLLFDTENIVEGIYDVSADQGGVSGSAGIAAKLQIQIDDTENTHASPVSPDDPSITVITMQQQTYLPLLQ